MDAVLMILRQAVEESEVQVDAWKTLQEHRIRCVAALAQCQERSRDAEKGHTLGLLACMEEADVRIVQCQNVVAETLGGAVRDVKLQMDELVTNARELYQLALAKVREEPEVKTMSLLQQAQAEDGGMSLSQCLERLRAISMALALQGVEEVRTEDELIRNGPDPNPLSQDRYIAALS